MSTYLALDLAGATGAGYWRSGMPYPRAWSLQLPQTTKLGVWLAALYDWAYDFVKLEQVTDIAVETPLTTMGNQDKIFKLVGAAAVIQMLGAQAGAHVEFVANSTFFSHWVGSNNFHGPERKTRSIMAAHLRGFGKVNDHNVADSLGVLTYRLHMLGVKNVPWNLQKGMAATLFEEKGTRIDKGNERAASRLVTSALSFDRAKVDDDKS